MAESTMEKIVKTAIAVQGPARKLHQQKRGSHWAELARMMAEDMEVELVDPGAAADMTPTAADPLNRCFMSDTIAFARSGYTSWMDLISVGAQASSWSGFPMVQRRLFKRLYLDE